LSAPDSTVATEYVPGIIDFDEERAREMAAPLREQGVDIDMPSLIYTGQRSHVAEYLRGKSWDVTDTSRVDLFAANGRVIPEPENDDPLGEIIYISGTLKG
jgi:O-methyltransferase involved in polyketide biosynthesis